jgi:DNA modification methylase
VPDEPRKVYVKYGQLWALGPHRLLCGDSLTAELGRALAGLKVAEVVEDPPYAIYGSSTGVASEIADWEMVLPFFEAVLRRAHELLPMFGHAYVFCDWRSFAPWVIAAKRAEVSLRNKLVWDKGGSGLGSNWANTYEEVAYFAKLPQQATMRGTSEQRGVRQVHRPNLLRFARPTGGEREHNAAKPVALLRELVTAGSDEGQVVLDMFCGSGSTLVACEAEGRICVTADKEPKWVQVALERWQRLTGRKAELVGAA